MQKGNKGLNASLANKIEQAQSLLNEVLAQLPHTTVRERVTPAASARKKTPSEKIDFSLPLRAYVKRYGSNLSGPKKFVLLLAHFVKGDIDKQISSAEIEKCWNKMTGKNLLGCKFSPVYALRAKEGAWVNTAKTGSYHLRSTWKDIF